MQSTSSILQCTQHWGRKNKAGSWQQWDDLIVLDPNRLEEPDYSMSIELLEGCQHIDIEIPERNLVDKYQSQKSIGSLLIGLDITQKSNGLLNHDWSYHKWVSPILGTHPDKEIGERILLQLVLQSNNYAKEITTWDRVVVHVFEEVK